MISADHITFDGDTAWWVLGPWTQDDNPPIKQLDRPCDTCDGQGYWWCDIDRGEEIRQTCGCIDGRHTFDIEVECFDNGESLECPPESKCSPTCGGSFTYRVSIVPNQIKQQDDGTWLVQLRVAT